MATAMFSDKVNAVVDSAIDKSLETSVKVKALVADGTITPEQGEILIAARESQVQNATKFAAGYFS
jgi:hypothetical protein